MKPFNSFNTEDTEETKPGDIVFLCDLYERLCALC
jgi:hypothetical protein